jgi:hypothetical protein
VDNSGGKNVRRFLDMSVVLTLRFDAISAAIASKWRKKKVRCWGVELLQRGTGPWITIGHYEVTGVSLPRLASPSIPR